MTPDLENTLILDTSRGEVVVAMRPDLAPRHVARVKQLVRDKFYDGVVFHRVIDGFMAQTGDPRGTVSMARSQSPDSADSQFFICFADSPWLDGQYTVWGTVIAGMENVDKIKRGEPVTDPDRIVSARIGADAKA